MFHNGSKFDFRLIIKHLAKKCSTSNVSCVAHSKETFLTFSINNFNNTNIRLKFIDSIKHLPYPLEKLVNYLSNNYKLTETSQETINALTQKFSSLYQTFNNDFLKLLRKGVFPYDYMDEQWKEKFKKKKKNNYHQLNIFIVS